MRALKVLHPCITVSDLDDALVFYRDLLGFEVDLFTHDPEELGTLLGMTDPHVPSAIVKCPDGTEIELLEFQRPRGDSLVTRRFEDSGVMVITLVVDELDALVEKLVVAGYPVNGPIVPFKGDNGDVRAVTCFGPDRMPHTLLEPPAGVTL